MIDILSPANKVAPVTGAEQWAGKRQTLWPDRHSREQRWKRRSQTSS